MKHKHIFSDWTNIDRDNTLFFRICKCNEVEFKGNFKNYSKHFKNGERID